MLKLKQTFNLALAVVMILILDSCTISSFDSTPDTVTFSVVIDKMTAHLSCEGDGSSGTGDIYTRMTLWRNETPGGQSRVIAELPDVIVGLKRGESVTNPGIGLTAEVDFFEGMRLEALIVTREVDPNSTQIQELFTLTMKYDADQKCWVGETFTEYAGVCVPGTNGGVDYVKTTESRMQDNTCDISYLWTAQVKTE